MGLGEGEKEEGGKGDGGGGGLGGWVGKPCKTIIVSSMQLQ